MNSNPVTHIDMSVREASEPIQMELSSGASLNMTVDAKSGTGVSDYNKLRNKPTLNNKPLVGDVYEEDPTVPDWAKKPYKPKYTPEEVGAVNRDCEMSYADIKAIWDSVFKN